MSEQYDFPNGIDPNLTTGRKVKMNELMELERRVSMIDEYKPVVGKFVSDDYFEHLKNTFLIGGDLEGTKLRIAELKRQYNITEKITEQFNQQAILSKMVEVDLTRPDSFLIIKETLTRIGVASDSAKKLHQSCHILHKAGKYYITHFKLLFELDGKTSNIDKIDIARQNTIAKLLESWNLVRVKSEIPSDELVPMKLIKIVPSSEKREWELVSKHRIGRK